MWEDRTIVNKKKFGSEKMLEDLFDQLIDENTEKNYFSKPMHEVLGMSQMFKPFSISIRQIRNYFGEKIALYFTFLTFYTKNMLWMSLAGLGFFLIGQYNSRES